MCVCVCVYAFIRVCMSLGLMCSCYKSTDVYNNLSPMQIHMHGNNLATLYGHVCQEILPAELGGPEPSYHTHYWAKQLIGDESFCFGDKQIYWPDHCPAIK